MTQEPSQIVYTRQVLAMLGISQAWLYAHWLKQPDFPQPFKMGAQRNAWRRKDIEAWIDSKAAVAA